MGVNRIGTELQIQKFLRNNGTFAKLKELYSIDTKVHPKYPQLVLLKYSQIDSPFSEEIVKECRGIILDSSDNWRVVCWSFSKFFNASEQLAAKIDWQSAEVQEKVDGSLLQLYWYDNQWNVATSGTPDASGNINDYGTTFAETFCAVAENQGIKFRYLNPNYCYSFELCTPFNRVVVDHKTSTIYSIGSRDLETLKECGQLHPSLGALPVPKYPLRNIDECIKAASALDPLKQEGFVVVDKYYNRIKVKSPAYVMLHHAKDTLSVRKMVDIVRFGEYAEFATAIQSIPELSKLFDNVKLQYDAVVVTATEYYNRFKDIEDQKEFAKWAKGADNGKYASVLFSMRKQNITAQQALGHKVRTTDSVIQLLGV